MVNNPESVPFLQPENSNLYERIPADIEAVTRFDYNLEDTDHHISKDILWSLQIMTLLVSAVSSSRPTQLQALPRLQTTGSKSQSQTGLLWTPSRTD